ncbi:Hyaluronan synthase [Candidatus Arcanobacter lacustris]|uniref:Hyaluronan synthase n=1 Tax=Candidatus Arcanibacter lacustris TaxID=1607817 RepID=A0A0F5MQZ3_9RICK|nr:Hyaluronan synthase [Candidatus Arcanobacter lacustris]KKB96623.1 Hyaluronan synthase [Candidatus Arcanobacter lacustris]
MPPKISVIVPAYNHAPYIAQMIESIIEQTFLDIELLILDDASQDDTEEIVKGFADVCKKRFTKFYFYKKEQNLGLVDSIKKLVAMSEGEFIFSSASDDILKPQTIETLYDFIKDKSDYGLVVGNNEIINEKGNKIYWDKKKKNVIDKKLAYYKTFGDFLKEKRADVDFFSNDFGSYASLLKGNYIPNGYLRRASALKENIKNLENDIMEDWHLMLQCSKEYKFKYIDKILYSYRLHSTNTIKNTSKMIVLSNNTLKKEMRHCLINKLFILYIISRLRYYFISVKSDIIQFMKNRIRKVL